MSATGRIVISVSKTIFGEFVKCSTTAATEVRSTKMQAKSGCNDDAPSAKEVTECPDEENNANAKKIAEVEKELQQCESRIQKMKKGNRELVKEIDKVCRKIDVLDEAIRRTETYLEAKFDEQQRALLHHENSQDHDIAGVVDRTDKIEEVAKDMHHQVEDMVNAVDEHMSNLWNPVYVILDVVLHVALAAVVWLLGVVASHAGYQFEKDASSMQPRIEANPSSEGSSEAPPPRQKLKHKEASQKRSKRKHP
ncbi:hypothetical protein L596_026159 [Steinernema carpocapsae]|uniref:Transmembrane protein n=1 Tax=Steinernema carpocapsae TaxID=34508 RepID=A0A4U5M0J2_STECR|nr:hypothetical protein L596_026159 [Steinernema carpocapsae]